MDIVFVGGTITTFTDILLTDLDWVGTHQLQIRSTIGTTADILYSTNYIDADNFIDLQIVNPCETTVFTIPGLSKSPTEYILEAREMGGYVTF
jgi:hypothetical protein